MIELSSETLSVGVLTYGARISHIRTPDRAGVMGDVAVGFDTDQQWRSDPSYQGATVGRFAGRIAGGKFELDGVHHQIPVNEGTLALHGGPSGFQAFDWTADLTEELVDGARVTLRRTSPDGEMGFPGELTVSVTFSVRGSDLTVDFHATTDRPTLVNLTNHTYLNLAGPGSGSIGGHHLQIFADRYLLIDDNYLPTGAIAPVAITPFDFTTAEPIGARWHQGDPQLQLAGGYDHTFVLDGSGDFLSAAEDGAAAVPLREAARASDPTTGRTLALFTDQPGLVFYSGNMLDGTLLTRTGLLRQGEAFCLEPQHFPDAPHHPHFASTVLRPAEQYRHRSVYRFGVQA